MEKWIIRMKDEKRNTNQRSNSSMQRLLWAKELDTVRKDPGGSQENKYACAGTGLHVNSFLSDLLKIVQTHTAPNGRDCPWTGWIIVMQADGIWFFFFLSL